MRPRLLYIEKISFIFNREIKGFTDKQKLRDLSNSKGGVDPGEGAEWW